MTDQPSEQPRPMIDVSPTVGGWSPPWPNVAEVASVLPTDRWTLIGGLMTQLHTVHRGLGVIRPTNDVDIVVHIETTRGVPGKTAAALETIGYRLQDAVDPRNNTAHRFVRDTSKVDLVAGAADKEVVDVLMSDHPAPKVVERLRGREMVRIEGGTQALRRTSGRRSAGWTTPPKRTHLPLSAPRPTLPRTSCDPGCRTPRQGSA